MNHLDFFPVEINRADKDTLLRIPGVGVKSALRILAARRTGTLGFADLRKMGIVLKRAQYFITCGGKMMDGTRFSYSFIYDNLTADIRRRSDEIDLALHGPTEQLSWFERPVLLPEMAERRQLAAGTV